MKTINISYVATGVILLIAVLLLVAPLGKIEEKRFDTQKAQWADGDLVITFQPSFHRLPGSWPPVLLKGTPYRLSVMWVSGKPHDRMRLKVNSFSITRSPSQLPELFPSRESEIPSMNTDGLYYFIVAYEDVNIDSDSVDLILECQLKQDQGKEQHKTVSFSVRRNGKTHWVNRIVEAFMGF